MLMMDRTILQNIPAMHGASIVRAALITASTLPNMKLGRSIIMPSVQQSRGIMNLYQSHRPAKQPHRHRKRKAGPSQRKQ